ncbi:carboxylesterase/lipase family protein [Segetibacter sp. 3557_3]|uniref:carboxylesterase/lipase family protein n=1 Tax=Segetibacter sp. 3557_3 TaxID=2547429 RepID=UPI0010584070|nr:carboxylesterase family protein [Segetibacter sp. 3557_3]TDH29069.1 carboxylesterase/lipase family protein [Segetibacter sp. 3557_3]
MKKQCFFTLTLFLLMTTAGYSRQKPGPILTGKDIAVVSTKYGKVRGYIDDGIYAFKGIPYAKAERFMPPQAPDKWEDVRQTTIYGPQAVQSSLLNWGGQGDYNFGFQFNKEPQDEKNCFVLNVWSRGINDGKKRPVWVWIHGGGYASGSANQLPFFDGRSLAHKGDIVVVTVNHRLNVLGYADLRGLGGKYSESVNLGQQDLVAALQWVRDNVENFGGDPNSVTIDGQSGGGGKVSTLMAMPSATGLFQRAIVQSGSTLTLGKGEDSKAYGMAFAAALGATPQNTDTLSQVTYQQLVSAGQTASNTLRTAGSTIRGGFSPTVDGKYIVQSPFDPAPADFSKNVAMLIGTNLNEFTYNNRAIITPQTIEQVKANLTRRYSTEKVDQYIALYKEAYPNDNQPQHILTFDSQFRGGAIKQAAAKSKQGGAPAYIYLFTWQSPVNDGSLGASHGMELPFMFNNIAMGRTLTGGGKEAYELADKISSAWINFVKTGNPNGKGLPKWEPFNPEKGATMIFDNACKVVYNHDKKLFDFISANPPANPPGPR